MISSYLIENKFIGVKRTKHGIFMFNRNDLFIGRSLDLYGEWCEPELLLLRALVRAGDVVIDIGANIGTHVIPLANMVGNTGRVYAFEPQRTLFQALCGNVALNGIGNVWAFPKAVGASSGEVELPNLPSPDTPFNFGAVPLGKPGSGEKVELVTVDSLDLSACRLIKIDVEGMEAEVLEGAKKTVTSLQPYLFVENNTLDKASRTIEAIFRMDYRAYWHVSPYFHQHNFYGNSENAFSRYRPEANLLCVPKSSRVKVDMTECTDPDDNWKKAIERGKNAAPRVARNADSAPESQSSP